MKQMVRVLTIGCLHDLDFEIPHEEKLKMTKRGNISLVTDYFNIVKATLNEEERNSHVVPVHSWLCPISPFTNAVSQAIVVKEETPPEDSCLVWKRTTKLEAEYTVMNDALTLHNEAPITFDFVLMTFMPYLFNTCISYLRTNNESDSTDIKACHRYPQFPPDLATALDFIITGLYYFISTAMIFGSRGSASSWEPFHRAMKAMTACADGTVENCPRG